MPINFIGYNTSTKWNQFTSYFYLILITFQLVTFLLLIYFLDFTHSNQIVKVYVLFWISFLIH